jgi:hypothetical protein
MNAVPFCINGAKHKPNGEIMTFPEFFFKSSDPEDKEVVAVFHTAMYDLFSTRAYCSLASSSVDQPQRFCHAGMKCEGVNLNIVAPFLTEEFSRPLKGRT